MERGHRYGLYQVQALHYKEAYYNACGDPREIEWNVSPSDANFEYRNAQGQIEYGNAPAEWLKQVDF